MCDCDHDRKICIGSQPYLQAYVVDSQTGPDQSILNPSANFVNLRLDLTKLSNYFETVQVPAIPGGKAFTKYIVKKDGIYNVQLAATPIVIVGFNNVPPLAVIYQYAFGMIINTADKVIDFFAGTVQAPNVNNTNSFTAQTLSNSNLVELHAGDQIAFVAAASFLSTAPPGSDILVAGSIPTNLNPMYGATNIAISRVSKIAKSHN